MNYMNNPVCRTGIWNCSWNWNWDWNWNWSGVENVEGNKTGILVIDLVDKLMSLYLLLKCVRSLA